MSDNNAHFSVKEYIQGMDDRVTRRLEELIEQTKKTNGRVQELERWKAYLTGGLALVFVLGLPNIIRIFS